MATPEERHPELFRPVNTESPRGKKRTVPLECLCLGFNRTGTASMCNALETLGVPCWHSIQFMSTRFGDIEMWQEALNRKFFNAGPKYGRAEFDQLLHDYGAVSSDTPAIAFADDLIEAYPEAKVVLVEREIESWFTSWMNGVIKNTYENPLVNIVYTIDRWFTRPLGYLHKSSFSGWLGIDSAEDARRVSREKYREHYALVRRLTPPERLLEFNINDGWEPLCKFLGKPVPNVPFPHLNEKKWLDEKVKICILRGMKRLVWKAVLWVLAPLIVAGLIYRIL